MFKREEKIRILFISGADTIKNDGIYARYFGHNTGIPFLKLINSSE
jgi:hypothetical protein